MLTDSKSFLKKVEIQCEKPLFEETDIKYILKKIEHDTKTYYENKLSITVLHFTPFLFVSWKIYCAI